MSQRETPKDHALDDAEAALHATAPSTINLAELERLAKAAAAGDAISCTHYRASASPDVVLRLVAAIRDMAELRAMNNSGKIRPGVYVAELAEHGITDEAKP